jgi:hypothetical protein
MTNEVGGIDQGSRLPHPQVVNLDDNPNSILKTQPLKSLERQTLVFVDSNDQITPNHTFDHTFDIVSSRTSYVTYLALEANPIRKLQAKK